MKLPSLFKTDARAWSSPWPCTLSFRADIINSSSESESVRLFFEAGATNSILEAAALKDSLVISVESRDPYADFRESMGEAHGLREWDDLEDLLASYLRLNCTHNHHYILAAFIDLLLPLLISAPQQQQQCSSY